MRYGVSIRQACRVKGFMRQGYRVEDPCSGWRDSWGRGKKWRAHVQECGLWGPCVEVQGVMPMRQGCEVEGPLQG